MSDDDRRAQLLLQGRRRLRDLLPAARARANSASDRYTTVGEPSALFGAMAPHVRESNLDAVIVSPAPLGGWHCDLLLRTVPPGVPNSFGSPVANPFRTEREAEESAMNLLVLALSLPAQVATEHIKARPPTFLMNDVAFEMVAELFAAAVQHFPEFASTGYGSKERAYRKIEDVLAEVAPGVPPNDVDYKIISALSPDDRAKLLTVLHMAVMSGVFAWPPRRDAAPSDTGLRETMNAQMRQNRPDPRRT